MDFCTDQTPANRNHSFDLGKLGEQLVARWLEQQNWVILHHRWRCRWGELDLVAHRQAQLETSKKAQTFLAFVEVKTRSQRNWDAGGMLAITPSKRAKLWQTAQLFLAERPELQDFPCRFDVALVSCQRLSQPLSQPTECDRTLSFSSIANIVQLGQPHLMAGYQLTLQDYIQSAFD